MANAAMLICSTGLLTLPLLVAVSTGDPVASDKLVVSPDLTSLEVTERAPSDAPELPLRLATDESGCRSFTDIHSTPICTGA